MAELTPYDTGDRAEPKIWSTDGDPDRFGRVDFTDDEDATVATIYLERGGDGQYIMEVDAPEPIAVRVGDVVIRVDGMV